jgi:hypothetical protein
MPLLYGEGDGAFVRLQEEIIRVSNDQSIFAWDFNDELADGLSPIWNSTQDKADLPLLASRPSQFKPSGKIVCLVASNAQPHSMTNMGLQITLPIVKLDVADDGDDGDDGEEMDYVALLLCGVCHEEGGGRLSACFLTYGVGIWLQSSAEQAPNTYYRIRGPRYGSENLGAGSRIFKIEDVFQAKTKSFFIASTNFSISGVYQQFTVRHACICMESEMDVEYELGPPVAIISSDIWLDLRSPNRRLIWLESSRRT